MNAQQANAIPLSEILNKLGLFPAKEKGEELWYFSPFRQEKTPSFHIHVTKNIWNDFGESKGGKVVDFVCAYLEAHHEDCTVHDALRWLTNMMPSFPKLTFVAVEPTPSEAVLSIRKVTPLQSSTLIKYLESREIPASLGKRYLKEVSVFNKNTGKTFVALGLENVDGGYELRNKFFKGSVGSKDVTFIRGTKTLHSDVHIFEGAFDFLTALMLQKSNRFEGDAIILNSVSLLAQATPYIKGYSYKNLFSWFDNDATGTKVTEVLKEFCKTQEGLSFKSMQEIYAPHKDVNAWHVNKLKV
jgi:CHC2-type zinc finger protein/Toprim domain-containing protein